MKRRICEHCNMPTDLIRVRLPPWSGKLVCIFCHQTYRYTGALPKIGPDGMKE